MKLMYITNEPELAKIADSEGVDWIFIDLEILGKDDRQGHLDTVISRHNIEDIPSVKAVLKNSELLVRVDPINPNSKHEIEKVIKYGADIIMLPFFKKAEEVKEFIDYVGGRVKTCLLLETPESVDNLNSILELSGIDYIHIGLNDLHLGYGMKFMFELLSDGTVENIIKKIKAKNIVYGFGGIAKVGEGTLPAEVIIKEHIRLGSKMVILSRSFYKRDKMDTLEDIKNVFNMGVLDIRKAIDNSKKISGEELLDNKKIIDLKVKEIINKMGEK